MLFKIICVENISAILSWQEKEEIIFYSFHHRTKYIYKLRTVLNTQYKYRSTLISVHLIFFPHFKPHSLLSQFFLMTILENFTLFPLHLILKQKWAPISMILNLFLATDLRIW